jgi:putative transposase
MKRPQLIKGEIYHIVLRGVEQRDIFLDINDYYRGIFSLFEFNTTSSVIIRERRRERERFKRLLQIHKALTANDINKLFGFKFKRDPLVEILTFSLMPNHIHLLVRQIKPGGITKFIQKFATGYALYFNKKYNRAGHLFQGRYRIVHIKTEEQLKNAFVYIHVNSISLIEPNWKEKGIKNPIKAQRFVENYKWSSYLDYIGKKNFPSVTERKFLLKIMDGEKGIREFVNYWIKYKGEIHSLKEAILE